MSLYRYRGHLVARNGNRMRLLGPGHLPLPGWHAVTIAEYHREIDLFAERERNTELFGPILEEGLRRIIDDEEPE